MNIDKLKRAEKDFLKVYPGGFDHPDMIAIRKKHPVDKLAEFTKVALAKKQFDQPGELLGNLIKIVSRSSMVSMFEKPKFRDAVNGLDRDERARLVRGMKALIHGRQQAGFEEVLGILTPVQVAKWSLMTIPLVSYRPQKEVFVKPTTAKGVILQFELEGLEYKPRPSWAFYKRYREIILEMKALVDPALSPNNAAFTGFLMMSLAKGHQ